MRRLVPAILALLVCAACGGSDGDLVADTRAAASVTQSTGSAAVAFTTDLMGRSSSFEGVYDFDARRAHVTTDGTDLGLTGEVEVTYDFSDGAQLFVAIPEEAQGLVDGATHVSMDLVDALAASGIDPRLAIVVGPQASDPTAGLALLRGASAVEELGSEEIRGADTRHLRVTVDLDQLVPGSAIEIRDDVQELVDLYTLETIETEVWLDDDDRVRRLTQTVDFDDLDLPAGAGALAGERVNVTTEFHDFGADADIDLPEQARTVSVQEILGRASGGPG